MASVTRFGIRTMLPVLLALACSSCAKPETKEAPQQPATKVGIRLMWLNQAQFAGFYFADKAGYYKNQGLDVKLDPGGMDFPSVKMVAAGKDTFGVASPEQILLAREEGIPVVAVAVIFRRSPFVVFARKETNITTPKDLVGKTIGVKYGDSSELIYRSALKDAGVDRKKIHEVPANTDLTPLLEKKVDAWTGYIFNEPVTCEEKGQPVNIIWPDEYGVRLYGDTLFTTEDTIKNKPELVRKVVQATIQGWKDTMEQPNQAILYTLERSDKLNDKHESQMLQAEIPLLQPDPDPLGHMQAKVWQSMADLLLKQGYLKKHVHVSKAFTNQFLP